MSKGAYITIGLNKVDPESYGGWDGELKGCENDARDMASIAKSVGAEGVTFLTDQATSGNVIKSLYDAASNLDTGDLLILSYSGHGGQVGDVTADEEDGCDETWCLYDRQMIDDELYSMWSKFKPGVRILVFSDSCHSGTAVRYVFYESFAAAIESQKTAIQNIKPSEVGQEGASLLLDSVQRTKAIPFKLSWEMYVKNKVFYDTLQFLTGPTEKAVIGASVLLISGCQDNQLSGDGDDNGLFTWGLKRIWADGAFKGNYFDFRKSIAAILPPSQTPNYYTVGSPSLAFEAQTPFSV
jgi:hypothetical protein